MQINLASCSTNWHDNKTMQEPMIDNVADTAMWVAYYRAQETQEAQPLFRDPLAKVLAGEKGRLIAEQMGSQSRYSKWTVILRTCIIDDFILSLAKEGVDTVINLGAGLDTRPYRMNLPSDLNWIEVDQEQIIRYKEQLLQNEKPTVKLKRIALDLSDRQKRQQLFSELNSNTKKAVILMEGVVPYLTEEQMATVAEDLYTESNFKYWICEYFSSEVYRYLKDAKHRKLMKNAPFQFFPKDWLGFFKAKSWEPKQIVYFADESEKLKRKHPMPWFAYIFLFFASKETKERYKKMTGYILFKKMAKLSLLFFFFYMASCTSVQTIKGPDGTDHQLVHCYSIKNCYERASEVCGKYKIVNTSNEVSGTKNNSSTSINLLVKCEK